MLFEAAKLPLALNDELTTWPGFNDFGTHDVATKIVATPFCPPVTKKSPTPPNEKLMGVNETDQFETGAELVFLMLIVP
jgi:hypothetical protein